MASDIVLSPARDFFGEVRDAAIELQQTKLQLDTMRCRLTDRGDPYAPHVAHSAADIHGTSKLDSLMDREAILSKRCDHDRALIARAQLILYGAGGLGGVSGAIGSCPADVVWQRDCEAADWCAIARAIERSVNYVRTRYEACMDYLDSVGLDHAGDEV